MPASSDYKDKWITTESGTHVKVEDGETNAEAMQRQFDEDKLTPTTNNQDNVLVQLKILEKHISTSEVKEDEDGKYLAINLDDKAQKVLEDMDDKERAKFVEKYMKEKFRGIEFTLSDGNKVALTSKGTNKIGHNTYLYKYRVSLELDKLLETAQHIKTEEKVEHDKYKAFDYYGCRFEVTGVQYTCVLNIGYLKEGNAKQIYDFNQIEMR